MTEYVGKPNPAKPQPKGQEFAFVELLKSCARQKDVRRGTRIHAEILKKGLLERSPYIATTVIDMYAKCGCLSKAKQVFDGLCVRDVVPWTSLIGGYVCDARSHEAIDSFYRMQSECLVPNEVTFICILKACGSIGAIDHGKRIHHVIVSRGMLQKHGLLGNALVHLYVKCRDFAFAHQVLRDLPSRDEVSWSILIVGYVQEGLCRAALHCLALMQQDGCSPNVVTCVYLLKACGRIRAIEKGRKIHEEITARNLLEKNAILGNALLDMYARCGAVDKAHRVLDELPNRDIVSWNALTAGYARHEQGHKALDCVARMEREGISPNEITYSCILKACGSIGDIDEGKRIHEEIVNKRLLQKNVRLGAALVGMYAKCGVLKKAQQVLEELCLRSVVSWNALISGHVQHSQPDEALDAFQRMQREGVLPDMVTFACILKACGNLGAIDRGEQIHDEIAGKGLLKESVTIGNSLIDMYTKCGVLMKAEEVLAGLPTRDVVSWSSLIAGYAQNGHGHEALRCFRRMLKECCSPNEITFACVLKACGSIGAIEEGERIHDEIVGKRFLENNTVLGNALVDMYAACGALGKAQQVHENLRVRDVASWNVLIAGYARHGQGHRAVDCAEMMQKEGIPLGEATLTLILQACARIGSIDKGKEFHDSIAAQIAVKKNVVLSTALVNMYAKCGMLETAHQILEDICVRNTVAWNALIAGYVRYDCSREALECYSLMMEEDGLSPDEVTLKLILKACGNARDLDKGERIHEEIRSLLVRAPNSGMLGDALVEMYAKCGASLRARQVLEEIGVHSVASWNALMQGLLENEEYQEVLRCFRRMKSNGIRPNEATFVRILKACGSVGSTEKGEEIHKELAQTGSLKGSLAVGNALIDMYAKCGSTGKAREVLGEIPIRNVASWNALILGYAREGKSREVLDALECMRSDGIPPNEVTMLHVLRAWSQLGQSSEAEVYYGSMIKDFCIESMVEHCTCIVGALGGGGCFKEAMAAIGKMPNAESPCIWIALLGACRKWGNVRLARFAFDRAIELDPELAPPYALMAGVYSDSGMLDDVRNVEAMGQMHRHSWASAGNVC